MLRVISIIKYHVDGYLPTHNVNNITITASSVSQESQQQGAISNR